VSAASTEVIGRSAEGAELAAFADRVARAPAALRLVGDAGMGKTTLWSSGIELALERGVRVLAARPAAAERELPFTVLSDLLGGVLDEVLDVLPSPQARALRVALLLEEPHGAPPDERVIGASLVSALRALGAAQPLLLAADDAHWLDPASAAVLAFAWRRLTTEPVGLLLAHRFDEPLPGPLAALRAPSLSVGPLGPDDVHHLLRSRLGLVFPRPALRRLHAASAGNPFLALELGRAYDGRRAMLAEGRAPPLPAGLLELVAGRIAEVPPATRDLLAAVAALPRPTLAHARRLGAADEVIRPALAAHILELDGERLRFSHPLLAAAAYEALDPLARRALQRRLADMADGEAERAGHLALAADGPDEKVADALERAGAQALERGAGGAAAELAQQALNLTPPAAAPARDRRAMRAAQCHWTAGDTRRARCVLEDAVTHGSSREARAEALTELAWVHLFQAEQPRGAELARRALVDLDDASPARAHALNCLSSALTFMLEDLERAAELSAQALALAGSRGDVVARSENLCGLGYVGAILGRPRARAALREAERLGPRAWGPRVVGWPGIHIAAVSMWTDRHDDAVTRYRALHEEALERGDEGSVATILCRLALAEFLAGRWPPAEATATAALDAAAQAGERQPEAIARACRALVRASAGRSADARADAGAALAIAGERSIGFARMHATWALATLDLLDERPGEAAARLGPLRTALVAAGVAEPGVMPFVADEIEAQVACGRMAAAEDALTWLEERGHALGRASARAGAARGRGLLEGARGRHDAAVAAFERALEWHAGVQAPFERARTLLHLGSAQRRTGRRRQARASLDEARRAFETLGAAPWSERASAELGSISGRRDGGSQLTATEGRVAALVADGRTNKEIAAALFLSPRTVESHLHHVFAKLGVRSRTELARLVLARPPGDAVRAQGPQPPAKVQ
jgi:DNA-binding CsgD family transcriptional regulator